MNTDASEVFATESRNGDLFFGSDRPGGKGKVDIYMAKKTSAGYAAPVAVEEINTKEVESNPLIAPDESYLIFAKQVNEHNDLFISYRKGEHWSSPESLGTAINTEDDEYAPAYSPDHKLLYFTRTRFENNKRVKPGMIYSVRLSDLKLNRTKHAANKYMDTASKFTMNKKLLCIFLLLPILTAVGVPASRSPAWLTSSRIP